MIKKSEEEIDAEIYLRGRLGNVSESEIESFKMQFNENNKLFRINKLGAKRLLQARIRKEVYDELNGVRR